MCNLKMRKMWEFLSYETFTEIYKKCIAILKGVYNMPEDMQPLTRCVSNYSTVSLSFDRNIVFIVVSVFLKVVEW